ncbi:MAG: anthranilate synthase component I [bacterium]
MIKAAPSFNEFKRLSKKGNIIPLYKEVFADEDTPVSLFRRLALSEKYSYLLESLEGGEHWARYSFLSFDPDKMFKVDKGVVRVFSKGKQVKEFATKNPIQSLQSFLTQYKPVHLKELPRFWGGMVGYVNYDVVKYFEDIKDKLPDELKLPEMVFMLSNRLLIFDHLKHRLLIVVAVEIKGKDKLLSLYKRGIKEIESIEQRIKGCFAKPQARIAKAKSSRLEIKSNVTRSEFKSAVKKAKEYILAGDCIQIVLSQRFSSRITVHPFDIYRALRVVNPSPYLYYLKCDDFNIVGSSPEVLVRKEDNLIETRPIAGTRPRGKTEKEDELLGRELLDDPKELAEHVMLVDLGRNDLGKVAEIGSVSVPEFKVIEKYSHVMHIVSQVKAKIKSTATAKDLFQSAFPAGTVSGAPKIRAMEIIGELEKTKRGPYAGALGYFSFEGNMDMAITIRTILIKNNVAYVQAGAGIVADSVPEKEYQETRNKAQGLFKAIELAQKGLT